MSALDPTSIVAVIGAGTMGAGIALVAAQAGHSVLLHDAAPDAIDRGIAGLRKFVDGQVAKGRLAPEIADQQLARIRPAIHVGDLAPAMLVIEAIVENIDIKATVLRAVEEVVGQDAIITSNTSSLSITALASRLRRPERVAGMHFFNPAPLLPLVEIVAGHASDPAVVETIADKARAWGKLPVRCRSTPGFIVNRIARPFYGEAWRLLEEGVTDPATIDALLTDGGGFRMGPFTLMDMIGHDVNFAVTRSVYEAMFHDPRYRPSLSQQQLVDAGWLGRKSGRGLFDYRNGPHKAEPEVAPAQAPPSCVTVSGDLGPAHALADLIAAAGIRIDRVERDQPTSGHIDLGNAHLVLTDGRTATRRAHEDGGRPIICFDLCHDYRSASRIALAASDQCPSAAIAAAVGLFQAIGKQVAMVEDSPGLIMFRTLAMIINEGADALLQNIASAADIDLSMTKGVNYPQGPLGWCDAIGAASVARMLDHLSNHYGEDRYRTSPLLSRAALTGKPLFPDAACPDQNITQGRP